MGDVVIFDNANKAAALHRTTQSALRRVTFGMASIARATLATHKHDGHAQIETSRAVFNHFVTLNDDRGMGAAMTIEYGRAGDTRFRSGPLKGEPVPPMEPVAPLRTAMGLSGGALKKRSG